MDKGEKMLQQLNQREIDRQVEFQTKKLAKESKVAESESLEYIEQNFKQKEGEIKNLLGLAQNMKKDELPLHFDLISKKILTLQTFFANHSAYLRNYHIKVYKESIQTLQNELKETESTLLPKKKFGFKNRKTEPKPVPVEVDTTDGQKESSTIETKHNIEDKFYGFRNESGKKLALKDVLKKDVSLSNLTNCNVKICGAPSTLHVSQLVGCTVFTGPVSTSIFVENCSDSTFVISCQQLRLHSSVSLNIYLHVTSRAIMEDCKNIKVGPYDWTYDGIDGDYDLAGLDRNVNNWQCVDDFNWLNAENVSPNWRILNETELVHWTNNDEM